MKLSENALRVLETRYLLKDETGRTMETPEEMFRRVAGAVASAEMMHGGSSEEWESKFYDAMSDLLFLPNSPTLINAGKDLGDGAGHVGTHHVLAAGEPEQDTRD